MPCPKTDQLMLDYFSEGLSQEQKTECDTHLASCPDCKTEMEQLLKIQAGLHSWEEQSVPNWDRSAALRNGTSEAATPSSFLASFFGGGLWQWAPTASTFAMLCILLLNTTISSTDDGFSLSFGADNASNELLAKRLERFEGEQDERLNSLVARMEDRQDRNNLRLMQAVLEQSQQTTTESIELVYSYFERQRELDMQNVQVGYQQLADSDYETIRSLQQLANYVSLEGVSR